MKFSSVWMSAALAATLAVGPLRAQSIDGPAGLLPPSRMQDYQGRAPQSAGRAYWDYQSQGSPRMAMQDTSAPMDAEGRDVVIGDPGAATGTSEPIGAGTYSIAPDNEVLGSSYDNNGLASVYDGGLGGACGTCGCKWFGGITGLAFQREDDYAVPLVYPVGEPLNNAITTDHANFDYAGGFEVRLGRYLNDCWAVEGVYWGLFPNDQSLTLDSFGYPAGLTSGLNFATLDYDDGGGGATADTFFTAAQAVNFSRTFDYHNVELNVLRNVTGGYGKSSFVWLAGVRYLYLDETFSLGADLDNTLFGDDPFRELFYDVEVVNRLIGFQLGGIWDHCLTNRLGTRVGTKVGLFGNRIEQHQQISGGGGTDATVNTGFFTGSPYNVTSEQDEFSWITELSAGLTYRIFNDWRLTGGYRAVLVSDVALPYGQIPYRFSDLQEASRINANDTLLLHGIYAGLEYNW